MAKMTNLAMVKDILNDMDAEDITAIGDTEESNQVLAIIESTYFGMIADLTVPEHKELFNLTETDASSPSVMILPTNVAELDWVQMDVRTSEAAGVARRYTNIDWVSPEEFILRTRNRNDTDATVEILDHATYTGSTEVFIRNDRAPAFFTSFDDETLVFDAYNLAIDTFLLAEKTQGYGTVEPTFTTTDAAIADVDSSRFPEFLSICKNRANAAIGKASNPKEERWERKLIVAGQATKHRAKNLVRQTDFGRVGARSRPSVLSNRSNS